MKLSLDTKFAPGTGAKSGKTSDPWLMWLMYLSHAGSLKTEYKHEAAMLTADMDLALSALNASAVVGQKVTSILHPRVSVISL